MKQVTFTLLLFSIGLLLAQCSSSHYYVYNIEMKHPIASKELMYSNDTFDIKFSLEPKYIAITFTNKTDEGIKINWDDVSVSVVGNANRIIHKETSYASRTFVQPSTTIPPHSKLNDYLIRTRDVNFFTYSGSSYLTMSSVFPNRDYGNKATVDWINKLRGSEVNVFLPFYLGEVRVSRYYILAIKDIAIYKKMPKDFNPGTTPARIGNTKVKTK